MLLGQVKAGKSSFINTVATIDRNRMAQVTRAGAADGSLTNELKEYRPRDALKKICILDTMGLETNMSGLNVKDIPYLVHGNICPGYKFNPASPISPKSDYYRSDPKMCDKVNCVVYVVDANILGQDNVSGETKQIVKDVHAELSPEDIATFVVLTKIDVLCQSVATNVTNIYTSEKVKQAVNLAVELYKVPKQNIFPVKNYEHESAKNINAEILILLALRQMVNFGTDFLNHGTGFSSRF
ncbi:interferon-induced protein 44-like [Ruditapes philippinarum]|uniref:interferon-induced protein 44-like n=1 Tax=Ruditapes philippinarum TaxID=129788 RepID=UPI00295B098E|nr:interferon-induced protein 44-like [Ruditapes philippinarum]